MTTNTPKTSRVAFRDVASLLAPWRGMLALIALIILASALLQPVQPLLWKRLIDHHLLWRRFVHYHLSKGRMDGVLHIALIYLAVTALGQALEFAKTYLTSIASQGALRDLRVRLFAHFQKLPTSYFDKTSLGDSISRCTADVETIDTLFSSGVVSALQNIAYSVALFGTMIALSPMLTAVTSIAIIPVILITNALRIRIRDAERASRLAVGQMNTELQEILGGVEVIRAFGREELFVTRFRKALRKLISAFNRSTICAAGDVPIMQFLMVVTISAMICCAITPSFSTWGVSIGTLVAFIQLFKRFFDPITALGEDWQTVQSALSGTERIFQVLLQPLDCDLGSETDPKLCFGKLSGPKQSSDAAVDFQNVVFGYRDGQPVLHGVSMDVHAGEHVALVGRTGAGKSSMLHLIGGLYPPWEGTVRIAGRDPRHIGEDERRRLIGVVPQRVQLFSSTVLENLTFGDTTIPRDDALRAAAIAGADAFVRNLPEGYDTRLSDVGRGDGVQLSAGQRQLLALARALVWDPNVILLDEATASIDHASEAAFRDALREEVLARGRAVITVAHRLATAREADRVIVVDRGRIIEQGTPEDLIATGGFFAAWLELESAGWDWHGDT